MLRRQTEQFRSRLQAIPAFPRELVWLMVGALILVGVVYVSRRQPPIVWQPLVHDATLPAAEMDQLEITLADAGLTDCQRKDGQLMVPADQRARYLRFLNQATGFQFRRGESDSAATESSNFFESETQRQRKYLAAKAKRLGNRIALFPGIAWASVDYDEQSTSGFNPQRIQSASVVLAPKNSTPLPPVQIQMIQDCVSAAYAGMTADQVSVTDTAARKTYRGSDDPSTRRMEQAEYELEQRLAELLSGYSGLKIAATSVAQPPSVPPHQTDEPDRIAFTLQVSVGVPDSQFHRQWINDSRRQVTSQRPVVAPDHQQLEETRQRVLNNIRAAVEPLVLASPSIDVTAPSDMIHIWSFPDEEAKISYVAPATTVSDTRLWGTLSKSNLWVILPLASLVVFALVVSIAALRMRLRESQTDNLAHSVEQQDEQKKNGSHATGEQPDDESNTSFEAARLRNDLADLVESNPELAAQIVHSWMADAA